VQLFLIWVGVIVDFSNDQLEHFVAETLNVSTALVKASLFPSSHSIIEGKEDEANFWNNYAASLNRLLPSNWKDILQTFLVNNIKFNNKVLEMAYWLRERDYMIPLLSNISHYQLEAFRSGNFVFPFDPCFFSCECGVMKPKKEIYNHLLNTLKLRPEECLFIDDDERNIQAALDLHIHGIHFRSSLQMKLELEKLII
jgi:FMN phosphatase YigB (HAD superfamily)